MHQPLTHHSSSVPGYFRKFQINYHSVAGSTYCAWSMSANNTMWWPKWSNPKTVFHEKDLGGFTDCPLKDSTVFSWNYILNLLPLTFKKPLDLNITQSIPKTLSQGCPPWDCLCMWHVSTLLKISQSPVTPLASCHIIIQVSSSSSFLFPLPLPCFPSFFTLL